MLVFPLKAFYVAVWLSLLHMCCIGDIRLELQGTELVITGKQGMTGTSMNVQCYLVFCLTSDYTDKVVCRQQNGISQPVTCWNL